jgi:hypothetical protein
MDISMIHTILIAVSVTTNVLNVLKLVQIAFSVRVIELIFLIASVPKVNLMME